MLSFISMLNDVFKDAGNTHALEARPDIAKCEAACTNKRLILSISTSLVVPSSAALKLDREPYLT